MVIGSRVGVEAVNNREVVWKVNLAWPFFLTKSTFHQLIATSTNSTLMGELKGFLGGRVNPTHHRQLCIFRRVVGLILHFTMV